MKIRWEVVNTYPVRGVGDDKYTGIISERAPLPAHVIPRQGRRDAPTFPLQYPQLCFKLIVDITVPLRHSTSRMSSQ